LHRNAQARIRLLHPGINRGHTLLTQRSHNFARNAKWLTPSALCPRRSTY
jgi:hypothetical protein